MQLALFAAGFDSEHIQKQAERVLNDIGYLAEGKNWYCKYYKEYKNILILSYWVLRVFIILNLSPLSNWRFCKCFLRWNWSRHRRRTLNMANCKRLSKSKTIAENSFRTKLWNCRSGQSRYCPTGKFIDGHIHFCPHRPQLGNRITNVANFFHLNFPFDLSILTFVINQ